MNHEQFVNWLHGYFEIANPKEIGEKETQIIKDHLDTFFKKVTPDRNASELVQKVPSFSDLFPSITRSTCGCSTLVCSCSKPKIDLGQVIC